MLSDDEEKYFPLVLVADDDLTIRMLVRESLEQAGFRVEEAYDGVEALNVFSHLRPDIVLLDVLMPEIDGFTACTQIRTMAGGNRIPVVMMTGLDDTVSINRAYDVGATDFITKPINWGLLPHRIRYVLRSSTTFEKLRENEERFRAITESASDAIVSADSAGKIIFWNSGAQKIFSYEESEAIGRPVYMLLPERFRDADRKNMEEFIETGISSFIGTTLEAIYRKKDGSEFSAEVSRSSWAIEDKMYFSAIIRDVTERKRIEIDLRESEEYSQSLLNSIHVGIMIIDQETNTILDANPFACKMIGSTKDQIVGSVCHGYVCPAERGKCPITDLHQAVDLSERVLITTTGERIPILKSVVLVMREGRSCLLESFSDISDLKQAEKEIRATRDFLENIFATTADGIMVSDTNGYVTKINNTLEKMLGFTEKELIGKHPAELGPQDEEYTELGIKVVSDLREKGCIKNFESFWKKKDGNLCPIELNITVLKDHEGKSTGAVSVIRDITGRKQAEEEKAKLEKQLLQSQKLEAVGQLAGGIAHDFNNILSAIMGYGNLLQMKMKGDDNLKNYVKNILLSSDRAANLTRQLLAFTRKKPLELKLININQIIEQLKDMLTRVIGESIECTINLCNETTTVLGDSGQMEQILVNLAANARDAMPDGGSLELQTRLVVIDRQFISTHGYGKPGEYICLSVSDTGVGIDKKTKERIFEPFFTTKEVGKGTGLGLSIVYGIVKAHNGYIEVESETGKGALFTMYFPLLNEQLKEGRLSEQGSCLEGNETILFAEDESYVREVNKNILENYGYRVIEAVDGSDALRKFSENKEAIRLVILDVIMPKMDGEQAYKEIRKIKPDVKVIFTSGYTSDIIDKRGLSGNNITLLTKPVPPKEFLQRVRETINGLSPAKDMHGL